MILKFIFEMIDSENTQNGNPSIIQTIPRSLQVVHILDKLNKDQALVLMKGLFQCSDRFSHFKIWNKLKRMKANQILKR